MSLDEALKNDPDIGHFVKSFCESDSVTREKFVAEMSSPAGACFTISKNVSINIRTYLDRYSLKRLFRSWSRFLRNR